MAENDMWVEEWLSPERFGAYLRLAGGDRGRALDLHEWSARMNAALLHDFAHLEVGVRNMYDAALIASTVEGDGHWTDERSARHLFGDDPRTHTDLQRARKAGGGPMAGGGKVLAELSFGFWVFLTIKRRTASIWNPYLHAVYPPGSKRHLIHEGLEQLNKARNRVAHHEPVHATQIAPLQRQIRRYALYVSRPLADYIDETSTVGELAKDRP